MAMGSIRVLHEVVQFNPLVRALAARHIASRYRGSAFGFLWSILNPLCLMAVYTLVFHYYMRFATGEHYTLILFTGLLPWIWTSSALAEGTASIAGSGHLITKSMFPAHILPLVSVLSTMVNFLFSLPVLFIFMLAEGVTIPLTVLLAPVLMLLHALFLHGIVLALSALNVFYRDIQHLVGSLLTFLFFLCPIVYPASVVPPAFKFLVVLNPLALLTEMYRDLFFRGIVPSIGSFAVLTLWVTLSWLIGVQIQDGCRERFAEAL